MSPPSSPREAALLPADLTVGLQRDRVPSTTWVDAYYWRCEECGWLGKGLLSIDAAQSEAAMHYRTTHEKNEVHIVREDAR